MQKTTEDQAADVTSNASLEQSEKWPSSASQCKFCCETGDIANLEAAFNRLSEKNPPLDVQLRWQERLALAKQDYPSAIKTLQAHWSKGITEQPGNAKGKLTKFYRELKDPEAVLDCAQHALLNAPSFLPPIPTLVAAVEDAANPDDAQNILLSLYYNHPKSKPLLYAIFRFMNKTDPKKLRQFVKNNETRLDETDLNKLPPSILASLPAISAKYSPAMNEGNLSDDKKIRAALIHAERGNIERARVLLSSIHPDDMPIAGEILAAMMNNMPDEGLLARPALLDASLEKEVTIAETPHAVGTVIVFTGLADQAMMPVNLLDRYFAALGLSVVYLRDQRRYLYLRGVSELGNSLADTIASLQDILKRLQTKRLFTFGTSAGGFAAMRYGLLLGAESALCFSAPVFLAHPQETRAKIIRKRLTRTLQPDELDIRTDFAKHGGSSMRVSLFYGNESPLDRLHAELLASVKNVALYGIEDYDHHSSLGHVVCGKRLLPTISEHFHLQPISGVTD